MERVLVCNNCGGKIFVTNAQAGRQIRCSSCGAEITVPTLRGLADLPLAEKENQIPIRAESGSSAWRWRGPAMAVCLAVMVVCLGFAIYNLNIWARIDTTRDIEGHLKIVTDVLDTAGPDQLSHMWDEYAGVSLRRPIPTDYKVYSDFANNKLRIAQATAGIALAMLVSLILLWKSASWAGRKA